LHPILDAVERLQAQAPAERDDAFSAWQAVLAALASLRYLIHRV
jgi:hypothetical protein